MACLVKFEAFLCAQRREEKDKVSNPCSVLD